MGSENEDPRAWVGCLACYNGGSLVGTWVDGLEAEECVPEGHRVVCLSCGISDPDPEQECPVRWVAERQGADLPFGRGHYRGIAGPDGQPHEEQWVMDHEGYGGLLTGECSPMEAAKLARIIEAIDADGHSVTAVAAWSDHVGVKLEEWDAPTREDFEEAYNGEWDSEQEFAQEFAEDIGAIKSDATWPNDCIDWEQATDELMMDYFSVEAPGGRVYIFRS